MSEVYVIETGRRFGERIEAGLVKRERGGFRFFAASALFAAIENKLFRRPSEAERAAERLLHDVRTGAVQSVTGGDLPVRHDEDAYSLVDPLALPPDWLGVPNVVALSLLPFDR